MRFRSVLAIFCATAWSAPAQSPQPPATTSRVQIGLILGIATSGLTVSERHLPGDDGFLSSSSYGTSPYFGLSARRSLTPSMHAEVQAVFDRKGDDGAGYSIPFIQFPLVLEYTPFAPRGDGRWVRPVFIGGGSTGVRLRRDGGTEYWSSIRAGELSAVLGLGVEVHFRSRDWVQLAVVARPGLTDLQPQPGKTTSMSATVYIKAHPGAMRR